MENRNGRTPAAAFIGNLSLFQGTEHDAFYEIFLEKRVDNQHGGGGEDDHCVFELRHRHLPQGLLLHSFRAQYLLQFLGLVDQDTSQVKLKGKRQSYRRIEKAYQK